MVRGSRPVLETLAAFAVVFGLQSVSPFVGLAQTAFFLATPFDDRPWTLVTSVYAHGSIDHLVANAVALLVVGLFVARRTDRVRFHGFFVATGSVSGIATVVVGTLFGGPTAVLGASGAILALVGYLLAGNLVADTVLDRVRLSRRGAALVVVALAAVVVVVTAGPGVAITAHATGFVLGLVSGRLHLLRVG